MVIPILAVEDPVVTVDGNGVAWQRTGHCCRCGECCKSGNPMVDNPQPGDVCPLLITEADGLHSCADRTNPYYLMACAHWPSAPEHIVDYPSCTYVFTKVEQ